MPKVHLHETVDEMRKFNSRRKLKVTIYICGAWWNAIMCNAALSSSIECLTHNRESLVSNPFATVFRFLHWRPSSLICINVYPAIDSGGNVS